MAKRVSKAAKGPEKKPTRRNLQLSAGKNTAPKQSVFRIVGIGASAGGLEALEQFFSHLSPDTGMAFVTEFAGMNPGDWVLDVCCGTGAQVLEYGRRGLLLQE